MSSLPITRFLQTRAVVSAYINRYRCGGYTEVIYVLYIQNFYTVTYSVYIPYAIIYARFQNISMTFRIRLNTLMLWSQSQ